MPAPTPGYVKNLIRRSLREICDPSPKKKDEQQIWEYFDSECAYCGKKLNKAKKDGHIDHLVPSSLGGSNCISNRVLSCADCNEKEKLDMPWQKFLTQKNSDKSLASGRKNKILKWMKMHQMKIIRKDVLSKILLFSEFTGSGLYCCTLNKKDPMNIPITEREKVLKRLDKYNLNKFSLFGSEESLLSTIAIRELFLRTIPIGRGFGAVAKGKW